MVQYRHIPDKIARVELHLAVLDAGMVKFNVDFARHKDDEATECFTRKFRYILNVHAPWSKIQQRKTFCPWLTAETKELMKQRDGWKQSD